MDKPHSTPGPDERSLTIPAYFVAIDEYVALLLRQKDNLLDEEVSCASRL